MDMTSHAGFCRALMLRLFDDVAAYDNQEQKVRPGWGSVAADAQCKSRISQDIRRLRRELMKLEKMVND